MITQMIHHVTDVKIGNWKSDIMDAGKRFESMEIEIKTEKGTVQLFLFRDG